MTTARIWIGLLGTTLLVCGLVFGTLVQRVGAPVVWSLGFLLAAYGAWLIVQAGRGPRNGAS
ncbi:MAG: hypothetical protein VX265_04215 [Myxococcota bacterium]|nr:hypothetical protein [Myxococcota bacterium]MEC8424496.1 hypothetical protein [Myxococcota bacterium]